MSVGVTRQRRLRRSSPPGKYERAVKVAPRR